jgi:hypothetical protein
MENLRRLLEICNNLSPNRGIVILFLVIGTDFMRRDAYGEVWEIYHLLLSNKFRGRRLKGSQNFFKKKKKLKKNNNYKFYRLKNCKKRRAYGQLMK